MSTRNWGIIGKQEDEIVELRAEVASLRETCAHLSDRIGHWQTNAGINATRLARVDAEVARLTRVNAELAEAFEACIETLRFHGSRYIPTHKWDEFNNVVTAKRVDLARLTTQQGTNDGL